MLTRGCARSSWAITGSPGVPRGDGTDPTEEWLGGGGVAHGLSEDL